MPSADRTGLGRARRWLEDLLGGSVSPWPYAILRVGLATLVLLRTTTWDWLPMDHHAWVGGLEYHPAHDHAESPALHSPLWPFLPALGPGLSAALVWARTALAVLLLLGIRPRIVALALALVGYGLMASDRYRYLHHLHLLWVSVGLLALAPSGERLAPLRRWTLFGEPGPRAERVPRWPLQVIRFHLLVVYFHAGMAKLDPRWLSGETLLDLHQVDLVAGPLFDDALALFGASVLAITIALTELALPILLAVPKTRWVGLGVALAFHLAVELSIMVSTFGATMLLLATTFSPTWVKTPPEPVRSPEEGRKKGPVVRRHGGEVLLSREAEGNE